MEAFAIVIGLTALCALLVSPVLAIVALLRVGTLRRALGELERRLGALERGLGERPAPAPSTGPAPHPDAPPPPPSPELSGPVAPEPARERPERAPLPVRPAPKPAAARPAPSPPAGSPPPLRAPRQVARGAATTSEPGPGADFATQLGPRILVATGALAFVVFLALFVRYAWENDWVGPSGRVLLGALAGLSLIAGGLRWMARADYRPLGQGLAGMGLSGLYVSAFAAHGFYQLVPRGFAGALMLVITACAVLLAARLDARLFAALGWVGGYLTPVLLSTGVDRGEALLAYLFLLNLGALALDHRRPWPETLPLALLGTMVLYLGWYASFFAPERFAVAAAGVVLFTAQFGLGAAAKQRAWGLGAVLGLAALGLSLVAGGADRPWPLLAMSLALGAVGLRFAARLASGLAFVAAAGVALPLLVWAARHWDPAAFAVAAAWVVAATLLFVLRERPESDESDARGRGGVPIEATALVLGAAASLPMAASTDRPLALLGLLAAQGGVAALSRARWRWSELAGVAGAAAATLTWIAEHFQPGREREALALAVSLAGGYLALELMRGLALGHRVAWPEAATHLVGAVFLWVALYQTLELGPLAGWLGPVSAGLAALYLGIGLAARARRPEDARQVRVLLGLAAGFVTLAIPVQLGLHGIPLAWAVEGVLLLGLGVRFGSALARSGGYAVLAVAVVRLLFWHLPLHPGAFRPLLNAAFGTWLAVVAALAVAWWLARAARAVGRTPDRQLGPVLAALALLLLFGLLTGETHGSFQHEAEAALAAGDAPASQAARFRGSLAVSALWASYATALLAGGLGARSRPLFYAGYALFALTAFKLVLFDLATLQTLYRMLSFLVVALLLLAGAYLNLRFRDRLLPQEGAS